MNGKRVFSLLLVVAMVLTMLPAVSARKTAEAELYDLRVEDLVKPVGLDDPTPSFSWKMRSDAIGAAQTAYAITVSDGEEVLWNTDWVETDISVGIEYAGKTLISSTEYDVEIKVKDQDGKELSASTTFETGLLGDDPWEGANWISYTASGSDITAYTIDFDFIIDRHSNGFCFGMQDTGVHVGQFKEGMLFARKVITRGADTVVIAQNILNADTGQYRPVFIRCGKRKYIQLVVFLRVKIDDQFRCGGNEAKIHIGFDVNPVIHAKFFIT